MKHFVPQINLVFAWVWILAGFLSGMAMGLFFDKENWLGGYASHKRRMYRLGHIAFFGLGTVNFIFYLTARAAGGGARRAVQGLAGIGGASLVLRRMLGRPGRPHPSVAGPQGRSVAGSDSQAGGIRW